MELKQCLTCGGALERRGEEYLCRFCGNVYAAEQGSEIGAELSQAFYLRQNARFAEAEKIYADLVKKADTSDLAEVFWGLFLCEQQVLFEEDGNGEKFPSFYAVSDIAVSESRNLAKVKALYPSLSAEKRAAYDAESKKIEDAKRLYNRIAVTTEPYDIFICFKSTAADGAGKTKDYEIAQNIYNEFIREYNVFFSERTLETLTTREYEPNIYRGLYTAKVMLLLCSKSEYIESQWVKNEWSRYLAFNAHREKSVIPVFIDGFRAESLPAALRSYQGVKADINLMKRLSEVVKGIVKPVDKLAELERKQKEELEKFMSRQMAEMERLKETAATAAPAVQGGAAATVSSLLLRAGQEADSGDYEKAAEYYNKVLDASPTSAEAWLGLFFCANGTTEKKGLQFQENCGGVEEFKNNLAKNLNVLGSLRSKYFLNALRYAEGARRAELEKFEKDSRKRAEECRLAMLNDLQALAEKQLANGIFAAAVSVCDAILAEDKNSVAAYGTRFFGKLHVKDGDELLARLNGEIYARICADGDFKKALSLAEGEQKEALETFRKAIAEIAEKRLAESREKCARLQEERRTCYDRVSRLADRPHSKVEFTEKEPKSMRSRWINVLLSIVFIAPVLGIGSCVVGIVGCNFESTYEPILLFLIVGAGSAVVIGILGTIISGCVCSAQRKGYEERLAKNKANNEEYKNNRREYETERDRLKALDTEYERQQANVTYYGNRI